MSMLLMLLTSLSLPSLLSLLKLLNLLGRAMPLTLPSLLLTRAVDDGCHNRLGVG